MPGITKITDHGDRAVANLVEQFKEKPRIENVIRALSAEIQNLEDMFFDLLEQRNIYNAIGAQLDSLGQLFNEDRNGATDDIYRQRILGRISINKSSGTIPDIIAYLNTIIKIFDDPVQPYTVRQGFNPPHVIVSYPNLPLSNNIGIFLRDVVAAGVATYFIFETSAEGAFRFGATTDPHSIEGSPELDILTGFQDGAAALAFNGSGGEFSSVIGP